MLEVGMKAPEFTLPDKDGNSISLSAFLGKRVVLYFYPKDNTPGCSRQACAFAAAYEGFKARNVAVIGISKDSVASHQKFAQKYNLPFVLLSVAQGEVIYESKRNDDKYDKRYKRTVDAYGYEDDISQLFHKELIVPYIDPLEAEENARLDEERKMQRNVEIAKVRKVLSMLQPIQKQRLLKHIIEGKTVCEIAREEGTYHSSITKSINAAIKNFKKFYENL